MQATIISLIDRETYINDLQYIKNNNFKNDIGLIEYLCYREEIMNATKKLTKVKDC